MKNLRRTFCILFVFALLAYIPCLAFAHPNKTGSNGGYIDSGTSKYYYYNKHEVHSYYDTGDDNIRSYSYNSKNSKSQKTLDNDSSQQTTNKNARSEGTELAINTIFWGSIIVLTFIKESNDRKR